MKSQPLQMTTSACFCKSVTEDKLRKIDSALYSGRRYFLLTASIVPASLILVSSSVCSAVGWTFGILGLLSFVTLGLFEGSEKVNKEKKVDKNIRSCLVMNICNKIVGYCFPVGFGPYLSIEIAVLSPIFPAVFAGVISASIISGFFYKVGLFERDYEKKVIE